MDSAVSEALPFGVLLRRLRLAAGLSREALAERAGLSTKAVEALERGERVSPRPSTLSLLAEALQVEPGVRADLLRAARYAPRGATPGRPDARRCQLPIPPSPIIGRAADLTHVSGLLEPSAAAARLVTLVGPGGVGKTRLALAVAAQVGPHYRDGVVFVDLAPLHDARLVAAMIARALEVRDAGGASAQALLMAHLRQRQHLLVLDNFEHLLGAAPLVAELLAGCAALTVLATSRAALRLRGEHCVALAPLAVADATQPLAAIAAAPAVQLFVERAQAIVPEFALTEANAGDVARICGQLDGLPLAIELAAARVDVLPPRALLCRLERRLAGLPTGAADLPARQRTLRTALAWSHGLLAPAEQALFRRLAVFAGGWTLEATEAVCPRAGGLAPDAILDSLASLVRHSLVQRVESADGEPRFRMLETLREYAAEQLDTAGESDAVRSVHRDWCLRLAVQAAPELTGADQQRWLDQLHAEAANIHAALAWSLAAGHGLPALRLATAMWRFWWVRGYLGEGRRWLAEALAQAGAAPQAERAAALFGAGMLAWAQGDASAARAMFEQSLPLRRLVGNPGEVAETLNGLAMTLHVAGKAAPAQAAYDESLRLYRAIGDGWGSANPLAGLATIARDRGDWQHASALLAESLRLRRARGDQHGTARSLYDIGLVQLRLGDTARAAAALRESLQLYRAIGNHTGLASVLVAMAWLHATHGRAPAAAQLLGAADQLRVVTGSAPPPADSADDARSLAGVRAQVGEPALLAAIAAARRRPLEVVLAEALAVALDVDRDVRPPCWGPATIAAVSGHLTERTDAGCTAAPYYSARQIEFARERAFSGTR